MLLLYLYGDFCFVFSVLCPAFTNGALDSADINFWANSLEPALAKKLV